MTREEALEAELTNLLAWAEWHKARGARHPMMGEPNTGAIAAAQQALAMPKQSPCGCNCLDCDKDRADGRARLLRVAEAVKHHCLNQCDSIYYRHRIDGLDLAAIMEGVK